VLEVAPPQVGHADSMTNRKLFDLKMTHVRCEQQLNYLLNCFNK